MTYSKYMIVRFLHSRDEGPSDGLGPHSESYSMTKEFTELETVLNRNTYEHTWHDDNNDEERKENKKKMYHITIMHTNV
jgi:hypothetical protein